VLRFFTLVALLAITRAALSSQLELRVAPPEPLLLDQVVNAELLLTNRSREPLTVDDIASTCGCTVPAETKLTLAPGETKAIALTFHAGPQPGPTASRLTALAGGAALGAVNVELNVRTPLPQSVEWSDELAFHIPPAYLGSIHSVHAFVTGPDGDRCPAEIDRERSLIRLQPPPAAESLDVVLMRSLSVKDSSWQRVKLTPRQPLTEPFIHLTPEHRAAVLDAENAWLAAAKLRRIDAFDEAALIKAAADSINDPDSILTSPHARTLALALANRLRALASSDPDAYRRLTAQPPYRPIAREDPAFNRVRAIFTYHLPEEALPQQHDELVVRLWRRVMGDHGFAFEAIGDGSNGFVTNIVSVRAPNQLVADETARFNDHAASWTTQPVSMRALQLSPPLHDLDAAIDANGALAVAATRAIVRFANGNLVSLNLLHYRDPGSERWVCFDAFLNCGRPARLLL